MDPMLSDLMATIKALGANRTALIRTADIPFYEGFRTQCEQNVCGSYNKNWMCPPAVGSFKELKERAMQYRQGIVFQTVYTLEDSFDVEGMMESTLQHTKLLRQVLAHIRAKGILKEFLPLNVGPCTYCGRCSILDGQECRVPEEAIASVESYGIDVTSLLKSCGIPYNNGANTVSCVSLILFKQP